jgi:hypothetical protein
MARFTPEVSPKSSALMISRRKRPVYQQVWGGSDALNGVVLPEQSRSQISAIRRHGGPIVGSTARGPVIVTTAFLQSLAIAVAQMA